MTEQEIKESLGRYLALRAETENRLERLARLKNAAEIPAMRTGDGSQHTGSSGERMARAVEAYIEYEEQIRPQIEANQREMAAICAMVEALQDPMEREVLRLRYLDGQTVQLSRWQDVAYRLYGDDDEKHVHACMRLHKRAILNILCVQNGVVWH